MKRYFKHRAETDLGIGIAYIEFEDEWASRQVEIYGDRWFCSTVAYHPEIGPGLSDQPLSVLGLTPADEITQHEFEVIWQESLKHTA
ncbi:MAG: hypothetical protein WCD86_00660 [Ktedonobacteraceae bacterium]